MKDNEEILTVQDAAKLLKISKDTAYTWTHIKGFPKVKVGKTIRIPRSMLLDWVREQARKNGG